MKENPIEITSVASENNPRIYQPLFDDIYFSLQGGLAEKEYVFIGGTEFSKRLAEQQEKIFRIVEIGFGTGLNFLLSWRAAEMAETSSIVEYITIEKYPLSVEQLISIYHYFPELQHYVESFLSHYQNVTKEGLYQFALTPKIRLTLFIGDIGNCLPQLNQKVDSWYLDGFSPKKNPEMWSDDLFKRIGEITNKGGYVATYSAASFIRRRLEAQNFTVQKLPGFGHKRHRLQATKHE